MQGSLRSGRVRAFLVAEAISAVGTWATFIAIWGYAAFEFGASATDVSLFGVMLTLPGVLLGPFVGTVIDRIGPRSTLALAKVGGVVASLALLAADDFRTLAVLSGVHGMVGAFVVPALQSLPPRIVPDDELARTNALVSLTDEVAIVAGPVVGAVSIGWFGFRGAFVLDALTYLLGVLVLPLVHVRPLDGRPEGAGAPGVRDALDGLRLVARTPVLRNVVVAMSSVHLLYGAALVAEPLYVRDILERPESTFAALQAVFGVFLVAGGVTVARLGERIASFGWVVLGVGTSGITAVVYLGTPSVVVAFVGVAAWGVCTALLSGPSRTLLQRHAPESVHGRVLATDTMSGTAAQMIGIVSTGGLVATVGVSGAIAALGALVVVVAVLLGRAHGRQVAPQLPSLAAAPLPEPAPDVAVEAVG
ncbi:MAG TPA: MFS transporter [Acidimicrobiales bacterium]|nr:MFS transporter [Acidimicrobiales bacterium]